MRFNKFIWGIVLLGKFNSSTFVQCSNSMLLEYQLKASTTFCSNMPAWYCTCNVPVSSARMCWVNECKSSSALAVAVLLHLPQDIWTGSWRPIKWATNGYVSYQHVYIYIYTHYYISYIIIYIYIFNIMYIYIRILVFHGVPSPLKIM